MCSHIFYDAAMLKFQPRFYVFQNIKSTLTFLRCRSPLVAIMISTRFSNVCDQTWSGDAPSRGGVGKCGVLAQVVQFKLEFGIPREVVVSRTGYF